MTIVKVEKTVEVTTAETEVAVLGGGERSYFQLRNDGAGALTDFTVQARMSLASEWEPLLNNASDFSTPTTFLLVTTSATDPNVLAQGQQYQATFDLSLVYQIRLLATAAATTDLSIVIHP